MILAISSDRGLCGGINSGVVKYSKCIKKLVDGMYSEILHTCMWMYKFTTKSSYVNLKYKTSKGYNISIYFLLNFH